LILEHEMGASKVVGWILNLVLWDMVRGSPPRLNHHRWGLLYWYWQGYLQPARRRGVGRRSRTNNRPGIGAIPRSRGSSLDPAPHRRSNRSPNGHRDGPGDG